MRRAQSAINRNAMKIVLIISFLLFSAFVWALVHPTKVTTLNDIIVSTDPISAGRFERYTSRDCHNENVDGRITRNLVIKGTDEAPITLGDVTTRPIKCSNIIFIPAALPTGEYELVLDICFPMNPIRDAFNPVCKQFRSVSFKVDGNPALQVPGTEGEIQDRIDIEAPPEDSQGQKMPVQPTSPPGSSSPEAPSQPSSTAPSDPPEASIPPEDPTTPPPVEDPLLCIPLTNICVL